MNFHNSTSYTGKRFTLRNYLPHIGEEQVTERILTGLTSRQKHISSMFFYDATGSKLFEEITLLPEYYPTRTEKRLLHHIAPKLFGGWNGHNIVEIGSGDCSKISILVGAIPRREWETVRYIPVDVSQEAVEESAHHLQQRFPGIEIQGIVADFTRQLSLVPNGKRRLFCFLGSTLGNLSRREAREFFISLDRVMSPGETLLLGVDMIKPVHILEKAYNDSRGVTADFNRNILEVVNRLIQTDFDPQTFDHVAFYSHSKERIEMHLKASKDMEIICPAIPHKVPIRKGETIHTENSHKYTDAHIHDLAATGGLKIEMSLTDEDRWFSLVYMVKE
jgi:L-histidine N-alpha-methyltransferase